MGAYKNESMDVAHNVLLNIKFELRKHFRRKRFLIAFGITLFIALIFSFLPFLLGSDFPDTGIAFFNSNLGFIGMLIIIVSAIFAGDVISSEFEKKTGLLLFPTPQRRWTIFTGKYISALIPIILSVSLYYLVTSITVLVLYGTGGFVIEMLYSFMLAILYTLSVASVIFLFSSFMKRSITSSLVGFFLFMMIFPILSMIFDAAGIEPWFIVTYSSDLITNVLNVTVEGGFGPGRDVGGGSEPDTVVGIIVMAFYAISGFVAGLVLALRRRME
jgi:ABC-2 type transport system permease protein